MKKNILIFFIFFIFKIQISICQPYCKIDKDDLGIDGRKWYTYQLPKEVGVYFWDSITDTVVEKIDPTKSLRFDEDSAFLQTFNQFQNKGYNYVTYNDQPDDESHDYPMGAHSKGFFIWNKDGGIHVTHSITQFPYFKTKRNDPTIKEGKFERAPRGDLSPGLELFNHLTKSKKLKESKDQQGQHAYCYPISKEEIENGHIYRHLVLTNSIIGYVNDLAINFCLTTLEQAGSLLKSLNPTEFPRVNLMRIQDIKEFETRNTIYQNVDIQESQITTAILKDIIYYNLEDKFPLFILAKHALYFAQYSKNQHLSTPYSKDSETLYLFQKHINTNEKNIAQNYNKGFKSAFTKVEIKNIINIWSYVSTLKIDYENNRVPLLGEFFLQTQHYDDPKGRGKVPNIESYMNLVSYMSHIYEKNEPLKITRENDHSKQAFSAIKFQLHQKDQIEPPLPKQYFYNWFCVGDNNFMDKQSERGGSVHCFKSTTLCKFFTKKVYSYYYLDITKEKKFYDQKIQESINQLMTNVLVKEHEYSMFSDRLKKIKNNYQPSNSMSFPPPKTIDLYAEYSDGLIVDFKKFNQLVKFSERNKLLQFTINPVSFCWLSSYFYPDIFFCNNDFMCDQYKYESLCTEKATFSYEYYASKWYPSETFFNGHGIKNLEFSSSSKFEAEISLKTVLGTIYNSKQKIYFYKKPILPHLINIESYQDVIDFCEKKIVKDGKLITINFLYGQDYEYCVDLYKYCKTFGEGLLLTDVDEQMTNLENMDEFNCNLFSKIQPKWNQILIDSNKVSNKNHLSDQISKYRINID
ncbi:hypothetical protein ACTFIU_002785 [Dictyostelium citrinum]